jgi:BlaI family transcriptional regulator, penicillinase repressor
MPRLPVTREIPPPLELDCLRALWSLGEGNASRVRAALAGERTLAYTTVLTLLERLTKRGLLTRRKAGRSFVYTPIRDREAMRQVAVREMVELYFDGERESLLAWLQGLAPELELETSEERTLDATLL